jgi:hypothetical protein
MVALAACLLAFAPASAAVAISGNAAAPATPSTEPSSPPAAVRQVDETDLDPNLADASRVRHNFSAGEATLRPKGEKPGGEGPAKEPSGQAQSDGKSPSTTTTVPSTTTSNPPPTTTTSPPTPTATASTSTTIASASSDDGRSDDESAAKATGSISKAQVEVIADPAPAAPSDHPTDRPGDEPSTPPTTAPPGSGDAEPVESTVDTDSPTRERTALEWLLLTGEDVSQPTPFDPAATLERDTSTVVLSWLVERTSTGTSMAVLSPLVVLMTIWDAAASAGSGLAAPASGLGTLVLLVLVEKGHLVNGARLVRRRDGG